jgi:hypothetical protein
VPAESRHVALASFADMSKAARILRSAYGAFNARDLEATLELIHEEIDRLTAREGARGGRPHRGLRLLNVALCPDLEGWTGCPDRSSEVPSEQ